jgi:formate/nitrite transporter
MLAVLAGMLIAFGAAVASVGAAGMPNAFAGKVISGLLFPFGLGIIMLLGADLFTGNCMMPASVILGKLTPGAMVRHWVISYLGNFAGAVVVAAACVFVSIIDMGDGALVRSAVDTAASKAVPVGFAGIAGRFIKGIFCNVLVCAGVLCSMSARNTTGKILGAYLPVAFFVILGFEHSVANMYYIPVGLMAAGVQRYQGIIGTAPEGLTWFSFIMYNLLPVTLGNMVGGTALGMIMVSSHKIDA